MCDFAKGFKLCTCAALETKLQHPAPSAKLRKKRSKAALEASLRLEGVYHWTLQRVVAENDIVAIGRYILPAKSLEHGLDADWVMLNLNIGECFDFPYSPEEGDWLKIYPADGSKHYQYLSFIFFKGSWIQEFHDGISKQVQLHHAGIVHEFSSL